MQRKVREMRRSMRQPAKDGYVRLHWDPGTMQVDFGQADFDYAFGGSADGGHVRMHFLSMSFPYSNDARCEVFGDEKDVCVLMIEHDMKVVMGVSQKIMVLNFGRQIAFGSPQEVLANEAVVTAYLGHRKTG